MMAMNHELKTYPEHFDATRDGCKPFEIRKNDRNYQVGDILILQEYIPPGIFIENRKGNGYTGYEIRREVTFITDFAQQPGYVVMGLRTIEEDIW